LKRDSKNQPKQKPAEQMAGFSFLIQQAPRGCAPRRQTSIRQEFTSQAKSLLQTLTQSSASMRHGRRAKMKGPLYQRASFFVNSYFTHFMGLRHV
jgi:hypothetical protein